MNVIALTIIHKQLISPFRLCPVIEFSFLSHIYHQTIEEQIKHVFINRMQRLWYS